MPQINEISAKYHEGVEKLKKEKLKKTDDLLKEYKIKFESIDEEYERNLVETKNFYISEIDNLKRKKEESQKAIPILVKAHEESSLNLIKDFDKKMKSEKERVQKESENRKNKVQLNKDKEMHMINKSNDEKMSDLNKKISNIETIINGVKENTKISNEEERKKNLEIKDSKLNNLKIEYNNSIEKLKKDNITKNNNYITEFESNKQKVIDSLKEKEQKDKELEEEKNKKISDKKLEVESQINLKYIEEINDVQTKFNKLNEDYKKEIGNKSEIYEYLKNKDIENQNNFITLSKQYDENHELLNTLDLNLKKFLKSNEKALKYKSEKELLNDILEQKTQEIKNSDFEDVEKFIEESINKLIIDNDEKTKKTKKELEEINGLIQVYNEKLELREKAINEKIITLDSEKIKFKEEFNKLHKKINSTDEKELEKIKNKMISDEKERLNKEKEKELSDSKSKFENDISNLDKKFKEIKNNLKQNIEENQESITKFSLELNNKNFEISSLDKDFETFKNNININEDSELNKKLLEINKERDFEIEKSKDSIKSLVEKELESDKIKKEVEKEKLLETYNLQKLKINEMDSIYYKQSSELSNKIDLLEKENASMDEVIKSKSIKISDYKENFDKYTSEIRENNRKDYSIEKEMLKKTISGKKSEYDAKVSKVQDEIKKIDKEKADYLIILTSAELTHEAKAFILTSINEIDNKISFKNAEIDAITQEYSSKINEVNLYEGLNKKFIEADSKVEDIVNNQIKELEENKKELEFSKQKNNIEILKSKDEIKVFDQKSKEYQEKLLEGMKIELEKNTEIVENQYLTKYQEKYSEEFSKKSEEINLNFDILIEEQKTIELNNKIDTYKVSYLEKKNKINAEKADLESKTSDKIISIPKLQLQLDNVDSDRINENEKIISQFNNNIKGIEEKYKNLEKQNISDINNNYDNTQLLANLSEIELEIFNIEDKINSYNISLKNISKEKVENNLIYRKQDLESIVNISNEEMIKNIETVKASKESMIENLILIETSKIEEEFNNNKIKLDSLYKNTIDKINDQTTTINKLKDLEEKSRIEIEEAKINIDKIKLELYDVEQFLDSSKLEFEKNKKKLDTELIQLNENMKNDLDKKLENEIKKIEEEFLSKPMTTEFNPEKIISGFEKIKLEKIDKNNKTLQEELKNLEKEYENNAKKAIDVYNFSLNESYENLISKISDLEKNLVPDLEKLVEERKAVIDLHEANVRGVNTKYHKEFKTLEGIYEDEIKKVIKDVNLEEDLEGKKLNNKFLENMSRLEIDYDSKISKLENESKNKFIDMEKEFKENHIKNKENYYYYKNLEMEKLKNELKELENVYKNEIMV